MSEDTQKIKMIIAGILLNGYQPHHVGAFKEFLGYPTDDELREIIIGNKEEVSMSYTEPV